MDAVGIPRCGVNSSASHDMGLPTIHLLVLALAQGVLSPISASLGSSAPLDLGFRQMYNLEFSDAHKTFQTYVNGTSRGSFRPHVGWRGLPV